MNDSEIIELLKRGWAAVICRNQNQLSDVADWWSEKNREKAEEVLYHFPRFPICLSISEGQLPQYFAEGDRVIARYISYEKFVRLKKLIFY